jgi:hypothetical protein
VGLKIGVAAIWLVEGPAGGTRVMGGEHDKTMSATSPAPASAPILLIEWMLFMQFLLSM